MRAILGRRRGIGEHDPLRLSILTGIVAASLSFAAVPAAPPSVEQSRRHAEMERPRDPYMPGPGKPAPGYRPQLTQRVGLSPFLGNVYLV